ncbi:MAG: hypothetical protein IIC67_05235 [Thaumarchaeota archaeon]|nr:hypothetical protein [Nitrososphaerota archaeon]
MDNSEKFELYFQVDVPVPYKREQKETAINQLQSQLMNAGCMDVSVKDSYYIDRKSEASGHSFVLILTVIAELSVIMASSLAMKRALKEAKNGGSVFLKDKDGKYIKIDENMTAEEARKKLNEEEKDI